MNGLLPLVMAVASDASGAARPRSQMDLSGTMSLLTWVTFILAAIVLYRIAWKPILRTLDKRERDIAKSVEDMDKARAATAGALEEQKRILAEADVRARQIVEEARRSAEAMAVALDQKARGEARGMVEEAAREIERHRLEAVASLRREAAELAIEAAGRILSERGAGPDGRAFSERMERSMEPDARP